MTDKEIIDGLIARDNDITRYFLEKYNPLFSKLVFLVFDRSVDKNECINEQPPSLSMFPKCLHLETNAVFRHHSP